MEIFILIPLFIVVFISTTLIERKLTNITKQNQKIIELLEKIADKKD